MYFLARVADAMSGNFAVIFIATISLPSPIDARASPIWAATTRWNSFDSRDCILHVQKALRSTYRALSLHRRSASSVRAFPATAQLPRYRFRAAGWDPSTRRGLTQLRTTQATNPSRKQRAFSPSTINQTLVPSIAFGRDPETASFFVPHGDPVNAQPPPALASHGVRAQETEG